MALFLFSYGYGKPGAGKSHTSLVAGFLVAAATKEALAVATPAAKC
ncbi:hypothetical protein [Methylophilus sp.]